MPFLTVDGARLFYREHGGPACAPPATVVLLHGAGASSLLWLPVLRRLGRSARVVAPDLPGHGRSAPPPAPVEEVSALAEQVARFAETLGLREVALVGHSMGGAVALATARLLARGPVHVSRLVLVATAARLPIDPGTRLVARSGAHHLERLFAEVGFSPLTPPRVAARAAVDLVGAPPEVADADFRACEGFDLRGGLGELRMPALVVIGDDDRLVPPALGLELAGELPGSRVSRLAATGHMIPLERPAELTALLSGWLGAASPGRPAVC
jgi:pimeloyl-ACP methyl ester carboxylesterase